MKENQELIKLFAEFKKRSSKTKRIILIIGMILVFITFAIFTGISKGNSVKWLYSIPIALIIIAILLLVVNIFLNKINKEFKDEFLKKFVNVLEYDAIYTYDEIINKEDLKDSSILYYDNNYDYKFEENITGKIYDYKYKSSFLTIKKIDKNINFVPFSGRIFIVDYFDNLDFFILEKNNDYSAKLDNLKFENDILSIYSNDYEKAKKILKPNIIKNLTKHLNNRKMKVTIEFKHNKIYITTWNKKNKYALSEMNTINNIQQDYIHELNVLKDILDVLEL